MSRTTYGSVASYAGFLKGDEIITLSQYVRPKPPGR